MMIKFKIKPLLIAVSLSCISVNTWALLSSNKLIVNSINGDNVTATANFPTPVAGDLYLATEFGGQFYFMGPSASLFTATVPFQANGSFSADITVLDIPSAGIAPGVYPLYQVVTQPGADPMNFGNWIGGLSSLGKLEFSINLNTDPIPGPIIDSTDLAFESTMDLEPIPAEVLAAEPIPVIPRPIPPTAEQIAQIGADSMIVPIDSEPISDSDLISAPVNELDLAKQIPGIPAAS